MMKKILSRLLLALAFIGALPVHAAGSSGIVEKLFIQPGAGAVPRTFLDKAQETVSAADFGACSLCPAAQNTAAIQAAINTNKSITIPSGVYDINDELKPKSNQVITGAGQGVTTIRQTVASKNGFTLTNLSFSVLRDMTVTSNAASPTGAGVAITGGGNDFLTDLQISSFFKGGLFTSTGTLTVTRLYVSGNVSHGLHINSIGTASVGIWLRDVYSLANTGDGLAITGLVSGVYLDTLELSQNAANGFEAVTDGTGSPSSIFAKRIIADTNGQSGIIVGTGVSQVTFEGMFASNRGTGFNFYSQGSDVAVIGGKFYNCNGPGMKFAGGSRNSVIGATIQDAGINAANTYDGITSSISGLTISGVTVFSGSNKTRYGISLTAGASNTIVSGSNLTGNISGAYNDISGGAQNAVVSSAGAMTTAWTPVIDFESEQVGAFTYATQYGRSTLVGNRVYCDFVISWTGAPTGGNAMRVSGFPVIVGENNSVSGTFGYVSGVTFTPTTGTGPGSQLVVGSYTGDHVAILVNGSGAAYGDPRLAGSGLAASGQLAGSFSYLIK